MMTALLVETVINAATMALWTRISAPLRRASLL